MIRQLQAILAVTVIFLAISKRAAGVSEPSDLEARQDAISNLLSHLYEGTELKPEVRERLTGQSIDDVRPTGSYPKLKEATKKLNDRISSGVLPRGRIFSVYNPYQLDEAVLIFNVFYWAPTIWHLLWAIFRYYPKVNENQFNYALTVALIHREDTKWLSIPQPYKIYPEYFFNSDVMKQIYDYKIGHCGAGGNYSVEANYTNWYISNPLDRNIHLTYFMEDIGLNTWYYFVNQRYPFWMSSDEYPDVDLASRGEIYVHVHKTVLNRYNMELLSHGMNFVDFPDWNRPITEGYSPYMAYKNGLHFPVRPADSNIPVWKNQYLNDLQQFESRVAEVVNSGLVMMKNGILVSIRTGGGIEILGNLVQGNNDSYNSQYYGSVDAYGRNVLGFSPEPRDWYQILPSALDHFSTSLRDPAFYRHYTRINNYFVSYKRYLGPYTPAALNFEGVTINNVTISEQLVTYFEKVETVIGRSNPGQPAVTVIQRRLNHRPYTYQIDVTSTKNVNTSIRIFLGPKYDVRRKIIIDNHENFIEIDYFVSQLTEGRNVLERASADASGLAPDHTRSEAFHCITEDAEKLAFEKSRYAFPARLLLPRGKPEGMPVQFFFYISEFVEDTNRPSQSHFVPGDGRPLGFPLDRPPFDFSSSNMYFLDKLIFYEDETTINLTTN